jgi:NAD(P)-dependent dehydrogenase (short-subunit alcohol dehydrogenase family)
MPDRRFEGKTAIVTGAAGNIGRAVARRLASDGAAVLVVDLDDAGVRKTQAVIEGDGGTVRAFAADVTDPEAVRAYVKEAKRMGTNRVDVFFNNAGIEGPVAPLDEYAESAFDQVLAVNVRGVFLGLRYVAPAMSAGGAIVNTASTAGVVGFAGLSGYVASKHAVVGLTRSAALDFARRGVRVNAICPGPVEGRMMTSLEDAVDPESGRAAFLATVPLGRYAAPEEMANTVTFLLSDEARFATGAIFAVDGGQTTG